MIRNKEIRNFILCQLLITIITGVMIYFFPWLGVYIGVIGCMTLIGISYIYTKHRYKKLSDLSDSVSKIANGDYFLHLEDYDEGELSYLKNEIHKVTVRLMDQSELLLKDKTYLSHTLSDISHQKT